MKLSLLKSLVRGLRRAIPVLILPALAAPRLAQAYPPTPYHLITGLVRDELGQPISTPGAYILFQATNGVKLMAPIVPGLAPGVNFQVQVTMDSMLFKDLYSPAALQPNMPFRISVWMNSITYLPIEMSGNYARLGPAAGITTIDLTLGVDANGDGLPDAWQQLLRDMLGANTLVGPNDSALNDGISNRAKYLAGVYAWDPKDGFRLAIVPRPGARPVVEFNGVGGHSYTLLSSTNLTDWTVLSFKLPANGPDDSPRSTFFTPGTQKLQFEPQHSPDDSTVHHFYKLQVQ